MDSDNFPIERVNRIEGFERKDNFTKKDQYKPKKQNKKFHYQELFLKHFSKNLDNFDIMVVIKDSKKMFRIYSKKTNKEYFQDYHCLCEILNSCDSNDIYPGINLDIKV